MGLLRFLLAVSVVLSHSGGFFYYNMVGPEVAVLTFFMISGFLMQLILTSKYDPVSEKSLFWSNRFLRIYPLYLVAIVFALSLNLIFLSIGSDYFDLLVQRAPYLDAGDWALLIGTQVSIVGQEIFLFMAQGDSGLVLSATGIDSRVWQLVILPPAWSLSIELMFYIAVPYLARLGSIPLATIVAAGFLLKAILAGYGLSNDPWSYRFFPTVLPYFILGMLSFRLSGLLTTGVAFRWSGAFVIALTLCFMPIAYAGGKIGIGGDYLLFLYPAAVFLALPPLLASPFTPLDGALGELSYPLYLLHWPIIGCLRSVLPRHDLLEIAMFSAIALTLSVIAARIVVVTAERPIDRFRAARRTRAIKRDGPLPAIAG